MAIHHAPGRPDELERHFPAKAAAAGNLAALPR
jgi:hypothetical protein